MRMMKLYHGKRMCSCSLWENRTRIYRPINQWNNKSDNQHIALKAFFVLLAVGLQKPGPKSKAKDHKECLKKRLAS